MYLSWVFDFHTILISRKPVSLKYLSGSLLCTSFLTIRLLRRGCILRVRIYRGKAKQEAPKAFSIGNVGAKVACNLRRWEVMESKRQGVLAFNIIKKGHVIYSRMARSIETMPRATVRHTKWHGYRALILRKIRAFLSPGASFFPSFSMTIISLWQ